MQPSRHIACLSRRALGRRIYPSLSRRYQTLLCLGLLFAQRRLLATQGIVLLLQFAATLQILAGLLHRLASANQQAVKIIRFGAHCVPTEGISQHGCQLAAFFAQVIQLGALFLQLQRTLANLRQGAQPRPHLRHTARLYARLRPDAHPSRLVLSSFLRGRRQRRHCGIELLGELVGLLFGERQLTDPVGILS